MSVKAMSWVWEHSQAVGNDRLVLLAIADRANDEGSDAWPSQETLCLKTRLSRRTVQRSIAALQELGELEVDYERGRVNRYRLVMRAPECRDQRQSDATPAKQEPSGTSVNLTPPPQNRRQSDARQIDTSVTSDAGVAPLLAHNTSSTSDLSLQARARDKPPAVSRVPLIARGEARKFAEAQERAHAQCHPEVCRWRSTTKGACMPAVLVPALAAKLIGVPEDDAIADVIAWALKDTPPPGSVAPADAFAYWTDRWDTTRATLRQRAPQRAGKPVVESRVVPDADSTDRLIEELTGRRVL